MAFQHNKGRTSTTVCISIMLRIAGYQDNSFYLLQAWNINWETKHMMIQLGDGKNVIFKTLSAECKVVHEFIGGYIFLSMRTKDGNQQLDQQLFHKLTGGWQ